MLSRVLKKQDFARMRIIGQFNLGFIIAEFNGDLYMLDQHACDEKFRYIYCPVTVSVRTYPRIYHHHVLSLFNVLFLVSLISTIFTFLYFIIDLKPYNVPQ